MPGKTEKKTIAIPQKQEPFDVKKTLLRWTPAAILIFTALLYYRATQNDITYFDDDYYILQNPYIRDLSFHGLREIFTTFYSSNYHPFTTLGWALIFRFFGTSPLPYHLLNVLLHLLNTWLAFKVAEQLSGKRVTAIVVSVLFAIHPMHVESVAWISELKDVLYAAFYLSALLAYLYYTDKGFRATSYVAALLFFLAALFSKSAAVTLPVLLIVIDIYKGRKINTKSLIEKIPFFLLALLFGLLNLHSQGLANLSSFGPVNRVFLFTGGLAFYLVKFVAPLGLCIEHYFPLMHGKMLPWMYYASLPFLLLAAWLVIRRPACRKEALFGVLFFLTTISVMLQILPVGSALVSERYSYIPYIGLSYIAGQLLSWLIEKEKWRNTAIYGSSFVVVLFSVLTWQRIRIWKNSDTLFSDVIEKNPDNGNICFILWSWGNAKLHEGALGEAVQRYSQAILINPKFDRAYCNRGEAYEDAGNIKAAIQDCDSAIKIEPGLSDEYTNRGWAYYQMGDTLAALRDYDTAIRLNTFAYKDKYAETYNDRGWAYYGKGDTQSALHDFNKAILLNPYFGRPYFNVATILSNRGDFNAAIAAYSKVLEHYPKDQAAYCMRGMARFKLKENNEACNDWNKAADLGNDWALQMVREYCK